MQSWTPLPEYVRVKTSKTGVTVSIPIFPLLYDELLRLKRGDGYVFSEQARMYSENAGWSWRGFHGKCQLSVDSGSLRPQCRPG